MTPQDKAADFFEQNERYNFYVYDNRGDKVGASIDNDTLEQACDKFNQIVSRLEPGKYHLKAKAKKGDTANSGLIRMDFVVAQNSFTPTKNSSAMSEEMLKMMMDNAYKQAKFDLQFEQMREDIKELKKHLPILQKIAENQKSFVKVLEELTDEDNDTTGVKRLEETKETVTGLMSMFDSMRK